jgi:hypothetical protein
MATASIVLNEEHRSRGTTRLVNDPSYSLDGFVQSAVDFLFALQIWQIEDSTLNVDHNQCSVFRIQN